MCWRQKALAYSTMAASGKQALATTSTHCIITPNCWSSPGDEGEKQNKQCMNCKKRLQLTTRKPHEPETNSATAAVTNKINTRFKLVDSDKLAALAVYNLPSNTKASTSWQFITCTNGLGDNSPEGAELCLEEFLKSFVKWLQVYVSCRN